MYYTYIIRSLKETDQVYIGATSDLKQRLRDHNNGHSVHTAKYAPWAIECYIAFSQKQIAYDFEIYLKSHAGRAFAAKRLRVKTKVVAAKG